MAREIKFRVWNNRTDNLSEPFSLNEALVFPRHPVLENHHRLMQFTGLKDKNGKEIYEGDIVRDFIGSHKEVVWREDMASFVIRQKIGASMQINFDDEPLEIIGNIYENPELLK